MANKRIDEHDLITPDGSELLLTQDSTTLEYKKATISSVASLAKDGFATVATTGAYSDLTGTPALGTAAATNATDYATATQGAKADTAVQPAALTASLSMKQDTLISGTNIKTVNGSTLLGSGDITISGGGGGAVDSVNGQTGVVVLDADDIDDTATTHKFVTSTDITKLSNLSGTNTGDQDLSSYATTAALAAKENIAKVTPIAVSTSTAAGTAAKVATTTGGTYTPTEGDIIRVTFTAENTATNPTINIDGSGAKSILLGNVNPTAVAMAGTKVMMWYDGTAFQLFGSQRVSDTSTTYSEISEAEITAGSASTTRSITGRRSKFIIDTAVGNVAAATQTLTNKTISGSDNTLSDIAQASVTNLTSDLAGKASSTHTHAIDDLSDVTISAPSTGQVIKYNGSAWVNDTDATSGGAGATNLSTTLSSTQTVIASDTGTDATIPAVDGTNAGVMTPTMKSKLDGIEASADVTDATNVASAGAFMKSSDDLDDITDGTTYKKYSATEKTKLAGIAAGATANSSDATLLARANHTGTQTAATISDFDTEVSNNTDVAANTAARHTHSNSTVLNNTTASFTTADETKLDGIEALADVTDATNVDAAGAVMNTDTSTASMSFVVDEDNMASNSATKVPTQQSVKAYVDTEIAGVGSGTGDVVGPASSTSGNIATFSGTTGKLIQDGGKALPTGAIVGTSDSQTLTNKTLTTPTISSTGFTNAQHAHAGATSGGQIPIANTTGTLAVGRGGTGATTLTGILKGNGTSAVTAVTAPTGGIVGTTDTQTLTNKTLTTPKIDSIAEATSGAGVTADGVLLKDGHITILGGSSAPATPATGLGKLAGSGTSNVRPQWINESGALEPIVTAKNFQAITTNSTPTGLTQQMGWNYVQGTGANTGSKAVTFPTAFTTIYSIHLTQLGLTTASAPTAITSFNIEYSGNVVVFIASDITTSGFNAAFCLDSSATLASNLYAGFTWIAYGVV